MKACSMNAFSSTEFSIATAICISITSISLRKRRPSSIALSSTTAFASSTSLRIANFYKCYRAFVRGKVESIQANSGEHQKKAARYFRLALGYAIAGAEPLILVVMGRVGTGKSTIAKRLASELDWPVFSSDETRKTLTGVPLAQRTPSELRSKMYSARMTQKTYGKLVEDGFAAIGSCSRGRPDMSGLLQPHNGVILDATFSTRALRKFLRHECEKANVPIQFVELEVDVNEIKKRLKL